MIQIDIPMPENCLKCPLKTIEEDCYGGYFYYCTPLKIAIRGKDKHEQRHRSCPLIEVKEDDLK